MKNGYHHTMPLRRFLSNHLLAPLSRGQVKSRWFASHTDRLPVTKHFVLWAVAFAFAGVISRPVHADCYEAAAQYQQVNPSILRAIAWRESRGHADALNRNSNGSTDYGLMQINSIHLQTLEKYGIQREALMEPCKSVYIAAWILRQKMNRYGNTWAAVGAYHSENRALRDRYAGAIATILMRGGRRIVH